MARENHRRRHRPGKDWSTVSIGIVTVATVIAAATVAAAINVNRKTAGLTSANQGDTPLAGVAAVISILSLGAYLAAAFAGLWALFRKLPMEQEPLVKLAAVALYAQIIVVVVFPSVVIFGPLLVTN